MKQSKNILKIISKSLDLPVQLKSPRIYKVETGVTSQKWERAL